MTLDDIDANVNVTGASLVDGRPDALHQDVCGQALSLLQLLLQLLPIQVVAPALPLRLQHKGLWMLLSLSQDGLCFLLFQIVKAPQACRASTESTQAESSE